MLTSDKNCQEIPHRPTRAIALVDRYTGLWISSASPSSTADESSDGIGSHSSAADLLSLLTAKGVTIVLVNSNDALTASAIVISRSEYPELSRNTTVVELMERSDVCRTAKANDAIQMSLEK